jgi:hypothetical protein
MSSNYRSLKEIKMTSKRIYIFGGGTTSEIRPHLHLTAPAYGHTARFLNEEVVRRGGDFRMEPVLLLSKMAGGAAFNDYWSLAEAVDSVVADPLAKAVIFSPAVVDFCPWTIERWNENEKSWDNPPNGRLSSANLMYRLTLTPRPKLLKKFRSRRKDLFVAGFKQTFGKTEQEQYLEALRVVKESSVNLVFANDEKTKVCMIVTPEEAAYGVTTDRNQALVELLNMVHLRSHLTFTQSTVVAGKAVAWDSPLIPDSLRSIVNHCIQRGAYKPFRGVTTGHFAFRLSEQEFITSQRKTDFNTIAETGMVLVKTDGPDTVLAYGAKPSVGGQSQRIIFKDHPGYDCIVHFHCVRKPTSNVPVRSQREFECGSHECGKNTSDGLGTFGNIKAVYLDQHGPNIVFNRNIDPLEVIAFIEENFDLDVKSGGYRLQ